MTVTHGRVRKPQKYPTSLPNWTLPSPSKTTHINVFGSLVRSAGPHVELLRSWLKPLHKHSMYNNNNNLVQACNSSPQLPYCRMWYIGNQVLHRFTWTQRAAWWVHWHWLWSSRPCVCCLLYFFHKTKYRSIWKWKVGDEKKFQILVLKCLHHVVWPLLRWSRWIEGVNEKQLQESCHGHVEGGFFRLS